MEDKIIRQLLRSLPLMLALLVASSGCSSSTFNGFGKPKDLGLASDLERMESSVSESRAEAEWLTSFDLAKKMSRETGKPILADFTGSDWCHWCKQLKKEVFEDEQFSKWAADNVILLELDYPKYGGQAPVIKQQNEKLRKRFQVTSYPTVLLIDGDENVIGKLGYLKGGPAKWVAAAETKLR